MIPCLENAKRCAGRLVVVPSPAFEETKGTDVVAGVRKCCFLCVEYYLKPYASLEGPKIPMMPGAALNQNCKESKVRRGQAGRLSPSLSVSLAKTTVSGTATGKSNRPPKKHAY